MAALCYLVSWADTDAARAIVDRVGAAVAPDRRQAVYEIEVSQSPKGPVEIIGKVSERVFADSLMHALQQGDIDAVVRIDVLPSDRWALPLISVANMRRTPSHAAELVSQALMGMPLRLLESDGAWCRVQSPDGYVAWINASSLAIMGDAAMLRWRDAPRAVVSSVCQTRCYTAPQADDDLSVVSDLVLGDIVEVDSTSVCASRIAVILPDGRRAWTDTTALTSISQWATQTFNPDLIMTVAASMMGQPYLWGGTSIKSLDCSGLVKVSYLASGIILPRDASQQALVGRRINASDLHRCHRADLLFFGNIITGRVSHVAMYDSHGEYIHSSGRVKRNSLEPSSPDFLSTPLLHCVRISGCEGSPGIVRADSHPWYFNL